MSKKQAVVIIGLLAAMLIGVAIVAGPGQSSGQNDVHLPIVANGGAVESSNADSDARDDTEKPSTDPQETGPGIDPPSEEVLTKMRELALEEIGKMVEVQMDGIETRGKVINIAGNDIKLPDNVYVEAYIDSALCAKNCPDTPYYYLKTTDSDADISVGVNTGRIMQLNDEGEKAASDLAAFQWLVDGIGSK